MVSVITGDIINSKRVAPAGWLLVLKRELRRYGKTPRQWEVYRGDSFQLEVRHPADALTIAIQIKAAIRTVKGLDVRLAIGIGDKSYSAKTVEESNGSAFVRSGELVEELKRRKLNLAIRSDNPAIDDEMNLYLRLALIPMNSWTSLAAKTVHCALEYPDRSQKAMGKLLGIRQNAVSTRLKRASFEEIGEVIRRYKSKLSR